MTIQNARSNTSGRVPSALQDGQIAINQADGVLLTRNPDGTIKRNLLAKRYGVADAAFTVRIFDTYVGIASLTASRAITLPAAASYPAGAPLTIADEAGACSPTVVATITAAGTDKINGNATYGMTQAFLGIILFSDGVSKWTAIALPGSGASNAVLYVAQSLTAGQQDQARLNLNAAAPASQTATTALALLDLERDQYVTGTSTLTMPGATPGWRSGAVTNDNVQTGIVTLAVPSGHTLDGTVNGSTKLAPKQRARLRLVSAGVWRTDWVERAPIVASATLTANVASVDLLVPSGYPAFDLIISGLRVDTAGAALGLRVSSDGGATFRSGSEYYLETLSGNSSSSTASAFFANVGYMGLADNLGVSTHPIALNGIFHPGGTNLQPILTHSVGYFDASSVWNVRTYANRYALSVFSANAIRILPTTGNLQSGATILLRGISS